MNWVLCFCWGGALECECTKDGLYGYYTVICYSARKSKHYIVLPRLFIIIPFFLLTDFLRIIRQESLNTETFVLVLTLKLWFHVSTLSFYVNIWLRLLLNFFLSFSLCLSLIRALNLSVCLSVSSFLSSSYLTSPSL